MIERIDALFANLANVERQLMQTLDEQPPTSYSFSEINRVRLMKETLRWLTGTSNYSVQQLAQGVLDIGRWPQ